MVEPNFAGSVVGTPARIRGVPASNFGARPGYRNCNLISILPSKFQKSKSKAVPLHA